MRRALVLFNIESGAENLVLKAVKIRADSMDDLKDVISNHLRQISQVRSTLTLILIEE